MFTKWVEQVDWRARFVRSRHTPILADLAWIMFLRGGTQSNTVSDQIYQILHKDLRTERLRCCCEQPITCRVLSQMRAYHKSASNMKRNEIHKGTHDFPWLPWFRTRRGRPGGWVVPVHHRPGECNHILPRSFAHAVKKNLNTHMVWVIFLRIICLTQVIIGCVNTYMIRRIW